jgi:hypothetical protein
VVHLPAAERSIKGEEGNRGKGESEVDATRGFLVTRWRFFLFPYFPFPLFPSLEPRQSKTEFGSPPYF